MEIHSTVFNTWVLSGCVNALPAHSEQFQMAGLSKSRCHGCTQNCNQALPAHSGQCHGAGLQLRRRAARLRAITLSLPIIFGTLYPKHPLVCLLSTWVPCSNRPWISAFRAHGHISLTGPMVPWHRTYGGRVADGCEAAAHGPARQKTGTHKTTKNKKGASYARPWGPEGPAWRTALPSAGWTRTSHPCMSGILSIQSV
jgi:hypothetical protein